VTSKNTGWLRADGVGWVRAGQRDAGERGWERTAPGRVRTDGIP